MKPSIGRIVHFYFEGHVCAAVVVAVHTDDCVNLTVFHPNGYTIPKTSINAGTGDQQWSWPPRVLPSNPDRRRAVRFRPWVPRSF